MISITFLIFSGLFLFCYTLYKKDNLASYCFIVGSLMTCITTSYINKFLNPYPLAIDVYRGNTTLEITYRDSIPIDSIVVFKK